METSIKRIAILGSTGSIGTQTLDIIEAFPDKFKATLLTANRNWELLARQALKFKPKQVVIADARHEQPLKDALSGTDIQVLCGSESIARAVTDADIDMVVTAMVGYSGLIPTIEAIKAGKTIALANKETLVVAGHLITDLARRHGVKILPVDSEHSAIFQCLEGEDRSKEFNIILTASGGPFRKLSADQLKSVTPADALRHPNWDMGAKVTIDSASMMNKGFEMIEARWLFDCPPERIKIAVHPQSIVHSMVEYEDGAVKAQLGLPDMHLPIAYAMSYPERLALPGPRMKLSDYANLTFEEPDMERFPLLAYAFEAIGKGGNVPCVLNAANEVGVAAFLNEEIGFTRIAEIVRSTMDAIPFIAEPTLDDLIATNAEAVRFAKGLVTK